MKKVFNLMLIVATMFVTMGCPGRTDAPDVELSSVDSDSVTVVIDTTVIDSVK